MEARPGDGHELTELFRELQLLRLKYEHVVDICRKLTKSWPNRGSDGKLIKVENKPTTTGAERRQQPSETSELERTDHNGGVATNSLEKSEPSDLKLLDNILKRAQGIKLLEEEPPDKSQLQRFATESNKKAAKVYQPKQPKEKCSTVTLSANLASSRGRLSSKMVQRDSRLRNKPNNAALKSAVNSKSRHAKTCHVSSTDHTSLPAVKIVKHSDTTQSSRNITTPSDSVRITLRTSTKSCVDSAPRQPVSAASSSARSVKTTHNCCSEEKNEEGEGRKFILSRDGTKLCMPSKYISLRKSLFEIQTHVSSQTSDPSTEAMRDHFVKRLIPQDTEPPVRALQLLLAKQEYQLLTDNFTSLSLQDRTGHDTEDVKEKLQTIVTRVSALEEELKLDISEFGLRATSIRGGGHRMFTATNQEGRNVGAIKETPNPHNMFSAPDCLPMVHSSLSEWLHHVELEHRHRLLKIEAQLLKFCTDVVIPKYMYMYDSTHERVLSTTSIRILSELSGQPKPIFISDDS